MYSLKISRIRLDNLLSIMNFLCVIARLFPQKKYILGLGTGCEPKSKTKFNSEFNSIHFGIEINKHLLLIFDTQKCLGLRISDFFET